MVIYIQKVSEKEKLEEKQVDFVMQKEMNLEGLIMKEISMMKKGILKVKSSLMDGMIMIIIKKEKSYLMGKSLMKIII